MKTLSYSLSVLSLLATVAPACKEEQPAPPPGALAPAAGEKGSPAAVDKGAPAPAPPPAPAPAPARLPVGMASPFPHLANESAAALNRGWAGLKAKKYDDAAAAFVEVATQLPDYLNARYQAARAYVLAGKMAEARGQLEELLRRNYVGYVDRVGKHKDFAALRSSPEWAAYSDAERRVRADYAAGLDQTLVVVARSGTVDPWTFAAGKTAGQQEAKLDWKQEVYAFDATAALFRALTATEGHVLAAMRSPDGKRLIYVTAERLARSDKDAAEPADARGKSWFVEPQVAILDLTTLETAGPIKLPGGYADLTLGFGASGTALVTTAGVVVGTGEGLVAGTYEMDSARTGLTKATTDPDIKGERVTIRPDQLVRSERPLPADVALSEDRHSVRLGTGAGTVITSARSLAATSLAWAPSQTLFAYAGQFDGCAALRDEKSKAAQNELYVFEMDKKSAQRIDSGASAFEHQWLGGNILAYEAGAGAKATVSLFDIAGHKKTTLPLKYGAGLFGIPTIACGPPVSPATTSATSGTAAAPATPPATGTPPAAVPAIQAAPAAPTGPAPTQATTAPAAPPAPKAP